MTLPKALSDLLSVSHETTAHVSYETKKTRLEHYAELLLEWNEKINLVAASTIPHLWERHFLDSAQLFPLLPPKTRKLVDMGSGAGFPGLVLACLGVPHVHLIESIGKKARFLSHVTKELSLNVTVHQERIEAVQGFRADVVTARALTALPELLGLAKPFMGEESVALFLKGQNAPAELTEAKKYWTFLCEAHPSQTAPDSAILKIRHVKALPSNGSKRRKR